MRCIRTVKALRALEDSDMQVIAFYTDVDREAPYVRHADHAVRLGAARDAGRVVPRSRSADRDAAQGRGRCGLAGLGLRRRVARVRGSPAGGRHSLPRPDRRHDAPARRQDRLEGARREARRFPSPRGAAGRCATPSRRSTGPSASACRSCSRLRPAAAAAASASSRTSPSCRRSFSRRARRRPRRSATGACSWRRWCAAGATSRCRSSPTSTASCARSAAATARCSAGIKR